MLTDGRTDGRRTDGRTTDAGVTGILIAHLGAFGSGELKIYNLWHFCDVYVYEGGRRHNMSTIWLYAVCTLQNDSVGGRKGHYPTNIFV